MKEVIRNLATVQMGYSFRSRLETAESGAVAVIQMKDLAGNSVDCGQLKKIDMKTIKRHHLVQQGDLVFRTRGHSTTSAVLLDDPGTAVVAAPLLIIRITKPDKILPEYLNWYISQRDAQVFLTRRAEGTTQKMISKEALEDLEVPLPSVETQQRIVELAALSEREQTLIRALAEKRETYISFILMRCAKGE